MSLSALRQRLIQKDDRHSWPTHLAMVSAVRTWERRVSRQSLLKAQAQGVVTAYVANFGRPHNIQPIVQALLASSMIGRVIVSNNNPDSRLDRWLRVSSDRVQRLEHCEPQSCIMRYMHLQPFASAFNLILDDDVFLYSSQIDALCTHLVDDPSVPHGLYGQRWDGERFVGGAQCEDGRIDVISRVYAFTDMHLQEALQTAAMLRPYVPEAAHLGWSDDIVLSCSREQQPFIHDLGPLIDCPSQGRSGIATWREEGFHASRVELFKRIHALNSVHSA